MKRIQNPIIGNLHKKDVNSFISKFGIFYRKKLHAVFSKICHVSTNSKLLKEDSEIVTRIQANEYENEYNSDIETLTDLWDTVKSMLSSSELQQLEDSWHEYNELLISIKEKTQNREQEKKSILSQKSNSIVIDHFGNLDPNKNYVFVCNHTCPEDIETILNVLDRNAHLVLGSIESARYDRDVFLLWLLNGVLSFDILDPQQRNTLLIKMRKLLHDTSIFIFPEASHNYSSNSLINNLYSGVVNLGLGTSVPKKNFKNNIKLDRLIEELTNDILSIIESLYNSHHEKKQISVASIKKYRKILHDRMEHTDDDGEKQIYANAIRRLKTLKRDVKNYKPHDSNYIDLLKSEIKNSIAQPENQAEAANNEVNQELCDKYEIVTCTLVRDQERNISYFDISDPINLENIDLPSGINSEKEKVDFLSKDLQDKMSSSVYSLIHKYIPEVHRDDYEDIHAYFMRKQVIDAFKKLHWDETEEYVRPLQSSKSATDKRIDIFDKEYLVRKSNSQQIQQTVEEDIAKHNLYRSENGGPASITDDKAFAEIIDCHNNNCTAYWMRRAYWKRKALLDKAAGANSNKELYDVLLDIKKMLTMEEFKNEVDLAAVKEAFNKVNQKILTSRHMVNKNKQAVKALVMDHIV